MTKNSNPPSEPARLDFDHVYAGYRDRVVLEDVSFEIPHGAQVAVIGPNGAGKSTLFKALVGLLPVRSGRIFIHGEPLGRHQDCVAYVPQREEVDWNFPVTVEDVVMMGRYGKFGWFGQPGKKDRQIVLECLENLGIGALAKQRIDELSGGQQQRVFLARALAMEPHILLMDEPFTGIDVSTQEATLHLLDDLKKQNVTALVSTHDLNLAAERFEKVILLNHRLIAYGTPAQVLTSHHIADAFGGHVLRLDGAVVVDECCPPSEERITH